MRTKVNDFDFVKNKLSNLVGLGNVLVHTQGGFVDQRYKVDFVYPLLSSKIKESVSFLRKSKTINVKVVSKLVKDYRVYYSGYITNDLGDSLDFKEIDNNFCINIG